MTQASLFMKIGNFFTTRILRSKIHPFMSDSTLVIMLTGRVSGELISTPVNYIQKGKTIYITSQKERTWWRNLRGGATVTLCLKGKEVDAWADVRETPSEVAKSIKLFNSAFGTYTKHFGLTLDEDGNPDPDKLKELASKRVLVIVTLPQ
jgi:hypothetical protein